MACIFSLFKLFYVVLSFLILADQIEYIYKYLEIFKAETFFSNNQFAHTMGMFLGLLFRISGLLSAIKEKIALTCTYGLFLLMILLLMTRMDHIFYLYLGTALYAFIFVVVLKYKRAKKRKERARANRALGIPQRTTADGQVTMDLTHDGRNISASTSPSAPPYEHIAGSNNINQPNTIPNYPNDLYFNPHHNTPPPSYSELYETK